MLFPAGQYHQFTGAEGNGAGGGAARGGRASFAARVSDTGLSISEEDQARLFRPSRRSVACAWPSVRQRPGVVYQPTPGAPMGSQISLPPAATRLLLLGRVRSSLAEPPPSEPAKRVPELPRSRRKGQGRSRYCLRKTIVQSADPDHAIGKPWAPGGLHGRWRGTHSNVGGAKTSMS